MKLLAWNINHRSRCRKIPDDMVDAISFLDPDIVVLTEFVPCVNRQNFIDALSLKGFLHSAVSSFTAKQNHVLVVSRTSIQVGEIKAPAIVPSFPSNFIHVKVPEFGLEVIGIRIPDLSKSPKDRLACWDWIESIASGVRDRPVVLAGDFNVDPSYSARKFGDRLKKIESLGWQHGLPAEGVSYRPLRGNGGQRLDHAFVTGSLTILQAQYIWQAGSFVYGGRHDGAMSDHAALFVEIENKH